MKSLFSGFSFLLILCLDNAAIAQNGGVSKSMLTLNEAIIDVKKG